MQLHTGELMFDCLAVVRLRNVCARSQVGVNHALFSNQRYVNRPVTAGRFRRRREQRTHASLQRADRHRDPNRGATCTFDPRMIGNCESER